MASFFSHEEIHLDEQLTEEERAATEMLGECRALRAKWRTSQGQLSLMDFVQDYQRLLHLVHHGFCKTYSYKRLRVLQHKYALHLALNAHREEAASKDDPRDFSSVVKVDTHIHLAAAATSEHLFSFIKEKVLHHSQDQVLPDGTTLGHLFEGIDVASLSAASLGVRADTAFARFDVFNAKYNPLGRADLRSVFLKSSNHMDGRYFAELTKQLLRKLESEPGRIYTEWRVSIYGRSGMQEWRELAAWVLDNHLDGGRNLYLVQIPRLFDVWHRVGSVASLQEMLDNIFGPVEQATLHPDQYPQLAHFLSSCISGFDSVDDESKADAPLTAVSAEDWTDGAPPYAAYSYHFFTRIARINALRRQRRLNEFSYRPHCGESGSTDHLAASYLLAESINHGVQLASQTPLQYLYYLDQIPLAVSPLSNHSLFLDYKRNPFERFFERGLCVSLSSDDPLQFHITSSPLLEEYSIASKRWNLSQVDLSEIARNSVLTSGFPHHQKQLFLGADYVMRNDVTKSNVPDIRYAFRARCLQEERTLAARVTSAPFSRISFSSTGAEEQPHLAGDVMAARMIREVLQFRETYGAALPPSLSDIASSSLAFTFEGGGIARVFRSCQICANDEQSVATRRCEECERPFCDMCDRVIHLAPGKRRHRRVPIARDGNDATLECSFSLDAFRADLVRTLQVVSAGGVKSFAHRRLKLLRKKFDVHSLLNGEREKESVRFLARDLNSLPRVDTHRHQNSAVTAEQLVSYIKQCYHERGDDVVLQGGRTMKQTIDGTGYSIDHLTLDSLSVEASDIFGQFDQFKRLHSPFGDSDIRQVFLKRHNEQNGVYLAELTKMAIQCTNTHMELRISVKGSSAEDWQRVAQWAADHQVYDARLRWVVQVPRTYAVHKMMGLVESFADVMQNFFGPLFECTLDPAAYPQLAHFLEHCSGVDSVDFESSLTSNRAVVPAEEWTHDEEPPFSYWLFHLAANLQVLNALRRARNLNELQLRPHAGSCGPISHPLSAFLLGSSSIVHGITMHNTPVEYLFYLSQVPVVMAPLAENALYVKHANNPLFDYYRAGLPVTLSTDNPLQLHGTSTPFMEELAVSLQMWRLSDHDSAELLRNAVLASGFPREKKVEWLGPTFDRLGSEHNDPNLSNISDIRMDFRRETLESERSTLDSMQQK